jgi:hypothetical protein
VQPTQKSIYDSPCLNQVGKGRKDSFPRRWCSRLRSGILRSHIGPHGGDECGAPIWQRHGKVQGALTMPSPEHRKRLPLQGVFLTDDENA